MAYPDALEETKYDINVEQLREFMHEDFQKMDRDSHDAQRLIPVLGTMQRYIHARKEARIPRHQDQPGLTQSELEIVDIDKIGIKPLGREKEPEPENPIIMHVAGAKSDKHLHSKSFSKILSYLEHKRSDEQDERLDDIVYRTVEMGDLTGKAPIINKKTGKPLTVRDMLFRTYIDQSLYQASKRADKDGNVSFIEKERTIIPKKKKVVVNWNTRNYKKRDIDMTGYKKQPHDKQIELANRFCEIHGIDKRYELTDRAPFIYQLEGMLNDKFDARSYEQNAAIYHSIQEKLPEQLRLAL